ncbi:hypothetical protein ACFL4E_02480 [Candidatus Omnitrophota bacterium]
MKQFFLSCLILSLFIPAFSANAELALVGDHGVLYKQPDSEWKAELDGFYRLSFNSLGYVRTLDHNDKDDQQNYLGYQYEVGLGATYQENFKGYIRFASYGPTEYDAPLAPEGPVRTIWGDVGEYWGKKMLPRLDEWWIDLPVGNLPARVKSGLFTYSVGSGLALGGYYEKYGFSIYNETDDFSWTFHFDVPDIEKRWYLGPKLIAEKEALGMRYDTKAYFFAFDMIARVGNMTLQPYIGFLSDMTPWARRSSMYAQRVDKDYLGTYGGVINLEVGDLTLGAEAAGNFGEAVSLDPGMPDMKHRGYFWLLSAEYSYDEKIIPRSKLYYVSGNKFVGDDLSDGQLVKGVNNAFSVYSPTDSNLADTHYPAFSSGPYVFTGMGNALNFGVWRPNTFSDPYQMTNLIAPNVGIDFYPTDHISISFDYWYLHTQQPPIGGNVDPASGMVTPFTLPSSLGNEIDLYIEYYPTDLITFSFLGGLFFPGEYFRKTRTDMDPLGIAAAPRYDGGASNAWQMEMAITFNI